MLWGGAGSATETPIARAMYVPAIFALMAAVYALFAYGVWAASPIAYTAGFFVERKVTGSTSAKTGPRPACLMRSAALLGGMTLRKSNATSPPSVLRTFFSPSTPVTLVWGQYSRTSFRAAMASSSPWAFAGGIGDGLASSSTTLAFRFFFLTWSA